MALRMLVIGDLHGKVSHLETFKKYLSWAEVQAHRFGVDAVVNLGDTNHDHAVLRSEIMSEFSFHISRCTSIRGGIKKYIYVVGNHDCFKPSDMKYHAMISLKDQRHLKIVDSPEELFPGIHFVPYMHQGNSFPTKVGKTCFCHQAFVDLEYGHGIRVAVLDKAAVDPNTLSATTVVTGHIHSRQRVGKVLCVGSAYAQGADDVGEQKGVHIVDVDDQGQVTAVQFVESPLPRWMKLEYRVGPNFTDKSLASYLESCANGEDHYVLDLEGPKEVLSAYLSSDLHRAAILNKHMVVRSRFTDQQRRGISIKATSVSDMAREYVQKAYADHPLQAEIMLEITQLLAEKGPGAV